MSEAHTPAVSATRIPGRYARILLLRGLALWLFARLMVMVVYAFMATSYRDTADLFTQPNPLVMATWTMALSAALVRIDLYRRHEVSLLNNLGVVTVHVVVLGTMPAALMETTLLLLR